jgi:cyclase
MLRPRIIPCLLIHNGGLVKTRQFSEHKYVGDPINAVRIFNEMEVDELFVADIDATALGHEPNFDLIGKLAAECRMPFCYGGGVKTTDQIERLIGLGVEKVALSYGAINTPQVIGDTARRVGSQSIVVVMDVKKGEGGGGYELFSHNGSRRTGVNPICFSRQVQELGAGEIVINSIDRDGMMAGYDLELVEKLREVVRVPMTVLGGAGSLQDIRNLISRCGSVGAAAGSLFVFKGKFRAVLIQYPSRLEKRTLMDGVLHR